MKKNITKTVCCITALSFCFTGCSGNKLKPVKQIECMYNIDDYSVSYVETDDHITAIRSAVYNRDTGAFELYGMLNDVGAEVYEKKTADSSLISSTDVTEEYIYEPYLYHNGIFYGLGLNSDGSQDDIFPDNTTVKSILTNEDGTEYRLLCLEDSSSYLIDVRSSDNIEQGFQKISNIEGAGEYLADAECVIMNDIKLSKEKIYIGGYKIGVSGNDKSNEPFVFCINRKDYTLDKIITQISIPAVDDINISETGDILAVYYDSTGYKTYVCSITDENTAELDSRVSVYSFDGNSFIYSDDKNDIYEYSFDKNESVLLAQYPELTGQEQSTEIISFNDDSYVYIKRNNISRNISLNYSSEGKFITADGRDDDFILSDEDGVYCAESFSGRKIFFENDIDTEIRDMTYDGKYFYLSDTDTMYVYDYDGKPCFQKNFSTDADIKVLKGSEHSYAAAMNRSGQWMINTIDADSEDVSEECTVNNFIDAGQNTQFINGDEAYSFYVYTGGILYGYQEKNTFVPLIDLSSCSVSGNIEAVGISESNITIASTYGLTVLRKGDTASDEKVITLRLSDSNRYRAAIEKYCTEHSNIRIDADPWNSSDIMIPEDMPDIIIANKYMDIMHLIKMGVFEDMYQYISDNQSFTDDYLKNIVDNFSDNGQLFVFPLDFVIRGQGIYTDEEVDEKAFCLKDFERMALSGRYDLYNIAELFLFDGNKTFIDYNELICEYTGDDFIGILDIWKKSLYNQAEYNFSDERLYVNSAKAWYAEKNHYFTGVPSSEGNDYYVESDNLFMISGNSENKEECIDFLKYLLEEETQKELHNGLSFPVNKALYDRCMREIAMETSDKYTEKIKAITEGPLVPYIRNNKVYNIIYDELYQYEYDERSAADVASVIQNKVKLYMSESLEK